jgi:hypothetical protein
MHSFILLYLGVVDTKYDNRKGNIVFETASSYSIQSFFE